MSDDPQNPLTPSYTLCSRLNPTAQSPTDHSIRRGLSVPCKGKSFTCKNFNSIDHLVIFNFACYSQLLTKLRSISNLLHNQLSIPPTPTPSPLDTRYLSYLFFLHSIFQLSLSKLSIPLLSIFHSTYLSY